MNREPVVAGKFYPGKSSDLRESISRMSNAGGRKSHPALAVVLPHAGYMYSGEVAALTLANVMVPETVLILGPNHTGLGGAFSLVSEGTWNTPLGPVPVEEDLAKLVLDNCVYVKVDERAHSYEHSIEVELPLLQFYQKSLSIVPLIINDLNPDRLKQTGEGIARALIGFNRPVLLVLSSDLTHYEPEEVARSKDRQVIESVLRVDPRELLLRVSEQRISMCGAMPVAVGLYAAKKLGARRGELIDYRTSGTVSGDYENVVGYAGIIIE